MEKGDELIDGSGTSQHEQPVQQQIMHQRDITVSKGKEKLYITNFKQFQMQQVLEYIKAIYKTHQQFTCDDL